ncbi:(Fe-S)-binding protein [Nitrosovibrio sp. Nv17]|jgi:glycolate oxidase iron-sulfur subunit|uniref:(Fe-S)-binding protein n=1 Tax=Nitrosovibrio sp. Nv17 TaxID=1855339 RepID=UPI0009085194|nr:glycolate oxidase iron-sulfur subunit [Nitrosovibrio sp. Nv17]
MLSERSAAGLGFQFSGNPSECVPDSSRDASIESLIAEANRCVACGLCLPHCPTYRVTQSEADSPRGRIALMSGVAGGRIPMNERFILHIDRCLTCRACEAACPNHVGYGGLVDEARAMIRMSADADGERSASRSSWLRRWLETRILARPARLDALRPLVRVYQRSGLQAVVRRSRLLGKSRLAVLERQLPRVDLPCVPQEGDGKGRGTGTASGWQAVYPATGRVRGEVGLFLGCIARLADAATLNATLFVLNRLGYTVHIPPAQACCGALHRHGGDKPTAARLARQNVAAFDGLPGVRAILSTASGCGARLAEYGVADAFPAASASKRQAENFSAGVMDIGAFLAAHPVWDDVPLAPLPHGIAVHEPCSLRNVMRASAHAYALLSRIPGARVVPLAGNDQCCGAAGTYFLDQPEMAQALLRDKMTALDASGVRYLATSNVGCALHIASGLLERGSGIEVLHPVTLLARQMGMPS